MSVGKIFSRGGPLEHFSYFFQTWAQIFAEKNNLLLVKISKSRGGKVPSYSPFRRPWLRLRCSDFTFKCNGDFAVFLNIIERGSQPRLLYSRLIINGQIGEICLLRLEWASPLQDVRPRSWGLNCGTATTRFLPGLIEISAEL